MMEKVMKQKMREVFEKHDCSNRDTSILIVSIIMFALGYSETWHKVRIEHFFLRMVIHKRDFANWELVGKSYAEFFGDWSSRFVKFKDSAMFMGYEGSHTGSAVTIFLNGLLN